MSAPKFACDDRALDPAIKDKLSNFYTVADLKASIQEWTNHFSEDGVIKRAGAEVQGRAVILAAISHEWENVMSQEHIIHKVFPFGPGADEVMLYGETQRVYEDGTKGAITWAARLHFVRRDGKVEIDMYHIYPEPPPR